MTPRDAGFFQPDQIALVVASPGAQCPTVLERCVTVTLSSTPSLRTDSAGRFPESVSVSNRSTLVCFSHLRWNFVWQRPQHILSRFADQYTVYYVEEPIEIPRDEPATLQAIAHGQITVLTPLLPQGTSQHGGFTDESNAIIQRLLSEYLPARGVTSDAVLWFYSPLAVGAEPAFLAAPETTVIYDVMDELAQFQGASPLIPERERHLFSRAHLVLTGGPRLFERRKDAHRNIHCFPSGVEPAHFAAGGPIPKELASLTGPVIGFYGVLDERIDFGLIEHLAINRPDWNLVMIGPLAKISENDLPRHPNIHYLGARLYTELPAYLSAFDVAMMPFALNEATEFISPTKTLEYLAGGKPVISTPIRDVVSLYGDYVTIASNADEFLTGIDSLLTADVNPTKTDGVQELLHRHDWDEIARSMKALVATVRPTVFSAPVLNARFTQPDQDRSHAESVQTVGAAD